MDAVKRCTKCGEEKPSTAEYFPTGNSGHLENRCKLCRNQYLKEYQQKNATRLKAYRHDYYQQNIEARHDYIQRNKEQISQRARAYNREHAQEKSAYNREYSQRNAEYQAERKRKYRRLNADRVREKRRENYRRNADRNREYSREYWKQNGKRITEQRRIYLRGWLRNNRHISTANKHRYRARKLALPDTWTSQHWSICLDYWNHCCAVCGRQLRDLFATHKPAADHWIALTDPRPDNPGTVPENILPLCHGQDGCNNKKKDKSPDQWLTETYGARKAKAILQRVQTYFDWIKSQP